MSLQYRPQPQFAFSGGAFGLLLLTAPGVFLLMCSAETYLTHSGVDTRIGDQRFPGPSTVLRLHLGLFPLRYSRSSVGTGDCWVSMLLRTILAGLVGVYARSGTATVPSRGTSGNLVTLRSQGQALLLYHGSRLQTVFCPPSV